MSRCTARVSWYRGLYAIPQHFQFSEQREIFNEQDCNTKIPYYWGIKELRYDVGQLKNKIFMINNAIIYLKNGTRVDIPNNAIIQHIDFNKDDYSEIFEGIITKKKKISIWMVVRNVDKNSSFSFLNEGNNNKSPFVKKSKSFKDENSKNSDDIELNFWDIKLTITKQNDYIHIDKTKDTVIKIGELSKDDVKNELTFNADYIPPLISIDSSKVYGNYLEEILEIVLEKKLIELKNELIKDKKNNILILKYQAIASSFNVIDQLRRTQNIHPYQIYLEFIRIISSLHAFLPDIRIDIIPYDHDEQKIILNKIKYDLRMLIEWGDYEVFQYNLKKTNEEGYNILICDDEIIGKLENNKGVFLCFNKEDYGKKMSLESLKEIIKMETKLAPLNLVKDMFETVENGITNNFVQNTIPGLLYNASEKNGYKYYFELDQNDQNKKEFWDQISKENPLALNIRGNSELLNKPYPFSIYVRQLRNKTN